jgi:hypothetical protein
VESTYPDGKDGNARQLTWNDVDWIAYGEARPGAMFVQVNCDLTPRIAEPHDQHALSFEG